MNKSKLIVAAAGSGKTTHLVKLAKTIKSKNVLITTFTNANEDEIKSKFKFSVPDNITIQTWFSFLIQHGVKPYQDKVFDGRVNGLNLVSGQSSPYVRESNTEKFFFDKNNRIYSDKLCKFIIKCDDDSNNEVINRISRIFPIIYIDEVQDLAGWDLEFLKRLIVHPNIDVILMGDPRQGTYSTNNAKKNKGFKKSKIIHFFESKDMLNNLYIDDNSFQVNFRSNQEICDFSNSIFPNSKPIKAGDAFSTQHDGVFLVPETEVDNYLQEFPCCVQLRYDVREKRCRATNRIFNYGNSKGCTFDRTLIFPTKPILKWIKDNSQELKITSRSKFYVAATRAKYSVGIVCDFSEKEFKMVPLSKWSKTD